MKKILFLALMLTLSVIVFNSCGSAYNSSLKQVELNMSRDQIINLMGDKYQTTRQQAYGNNVVETIEYADRYKFHWFFEFKNDRLIRWWKESEQK